jgi:hypothetical protein
MVKELGWKETDLDTVSHHLRSRLRGLLLEEAVRIGHMPTVRTALKYFQMAREGHQEQWDVGTDVHLAIFAAGVIYGTHGMSNSILIDVNLML